MNCECARWARVEGADLFMPGAHHSRCPKFATEKRPRLFYYEEAESAWCPAPEKVENIVEAEWNFSPGDAPIEIQFKRVDMTDKELFELPDSVDAWQPPPKESE